MSITDSWPFIIPGLLYGIGALGIAITYRYLHFPDFTVLGSVAPRSHCVCQCCQFL